MTRLDNLIAMFVLTVAFNGGACGREKAGDVGGEAGKEGKKRWVSDPPYALTAPDPNSSIENLSNFLSPIRAFRKEAFVRALNTGNKLWADFMDFRVPIR